MLGMRYWIDLIEEAIRPASASFIARITADTEENRKHLEDLRRAEKEIEDEETRRFDIPHDVQRLPDYGTKEWEQHGHWLELELNKVRKANREKLEAQKRKEQAELEATMQGVRLAAKDAMDDMIEQDREVVSKLAKQALKSQQKDAQRIRKQAMRQLKK